jgi:spermidine synthase
MTTLATLLLELSLTRIFSVVFYYHFAFLAISIALFGLGAGGVFSYLVAGWRGSFFAKLGTLATTTALSVLGALYFLLTRHSDPGNTTLALVYFLSALPFFLSGAVVSLAIAETIQRVDRVYFYDLLGAAGGCLVLIPLLNFFGGPNTVLIAAALFAVSSAIWFNLAGAPTRRVAAVALALAMVSLVAVNMRWTILDVRFAKGQALSNERYVKWNSFSRIALAPEPGTGNMSIVIDADAATGIAPFDFSHLSHTQRHDLLYQGPGFPYSVRPGAKTLIIGPGGGWDVARAIASGSRDITGVEINPIIATQIMRRRFPEFSHYLYFRPEVHIVVEDGRSFVRRSTDRYQVLQATLVDTWASTAAGAFALSENNLYTTDAFEDYLSHLTDDGILAITRWGFEPPRESLRLLSLAMEALKRLGERDFPRHVMIVREGSAEIRGWGARDTVLISRKPFTDQDLTRARAILADSQLEKVYLPGDGPASPFGQLLTSPDPKSYQAAYPFDISPVGDNRPFFFYTVQPRDLANFLTSASRLSADYKINRAVPLLFGLVGISVLATAVILVLPPLLLGARLPRERGVLRLLVYFACIGAGYILIQVALIQKFVLFLGHPTYALTVIIFSMLISSGLGSFFSRRFVQGSDARLSTILVGIAALVAILAVIATPLTGAGVGWPLPLKILVAVLLIAPAGFLMGMPFPNGLARLEERHRSAVRWAWSLNAASSVMGSAGAIFFAIYFGLRETLLLGGALYLAALVLVKLTRKV